MRFLIAWDGSSESNKAVDLALDLLHRQRGDELVVVAVAWEQPFDVYLGNEMVKQINAKRLEQVQKALEEQITPKCDRAQVNYRFIVQQTYDPREILMQTINEVDPGLVLMGSRGITGPDALAIGSVSQYVLRHCKQPVTIVRTQPPLESEQAR